MRSDACKLYYVYIMASRPHGVLYVGMTSTVAHRTWQHREHVREGFTKRYWVDRLVYFRGPHGRAHGRTARAGYQTVASRVE
ncbi:MAG TPA: GIY-YIG nuclease family protein, partial [Hyphomicrobiaceae bacterium]|nr:GIY-YIG nuclease family protein [Hyphomicrobiaceae bacterium]